MNRFGELLRYYRYQCKDSSRGGSLTQQRLGELLGHEVGDSGYSGVAISDWERGKSHIHKDYRSVLTGLIKILKQYEGLHTITEANTLLLAGNYRPLDENEQSQIFPIPTLEANPKSRSLSILALLKAKLLVDLPHADENPESAHIEQRWTSALLNLFRTFFSKWDSNLTIKVFWWIITWWLSWKLTFALMIWPLSTQEAAELAGIKYGAGSLIVPALIALSRNTRNDDFWRNQQLNKNIALRYYTYLGAFTGFHASYSIIFITLLIGYYFQLQNLPQWIINLISLLPLIVGYAAADQVPFNQWRAFGRLNFHDGWIFSISIIFGPLFGLFFTKYYGWLISSLTGMPTLILAICLVLLLDRFYFRK